MYHDIPKISAALNNSSMSPDHLEVSNPWGRPKIPHFIGIVYYKPCLLGVPPGPWKPSISFPKASELLRDMVRAPLRTVTKRKHGSSREESPNLSK